MIPLLNLKIPANAKAFFQMIMNIATFDLVPVGIIYDTLYDLDEEDVAYSHDFEEMGYESQYF